MYEGNAKKYNDEKLAKKIWPVYQACSGSARKTELALKAKGEGISRPTLNKLIGHFDFPGELIKHQKAQVKKSTTTSSSSELQDLLDEVTEQKNAVHGMLVNDPANTDWHKLYGDYIAQIINIKKQIIAARQVNKDLLLADAFAAVVNVLLEQGQKEAAEIVTQNLENFAIRVNEKWRKQT